MSTTPHKATPEAWASVRRRAEISGISDCCVIVELAARVEALEARPEQWEQCASALIERLSRLEEGYDELAARFEALEREAAMNELRAASAEARPTVKESLTFDGKSLVERVAIAAGLSHVKARAAIRAVAGWLRDRGGYPWAWVAQVLEQEVDR